ncbi:MAG: hypothetical protein EBV34_07690, partial [Betaproteobacteria bacterium]|nr:hypothetical protein [Betaproteobacteria bacterium]
SHLHLNIFPISLPDVEIPVGVLPYDSRDAMRDLRTSIQLEEVNEAFRRYVRLNDLVTIMAGDFTAKKNP